MKRIFVVLLAIGVIFSGCGSKKKSRLNNSAAIGQAPAAKTQEPIEGINTNNNSPNIQNNQAHNKLDSLLENSSGNYYNNYNSNETRFSGASGIGTGGSYASSYYARSKKATRKNNNQTAQRANTTNNVQEEVNNTQVRDTLSKENKNSFESEWAEGF
ncbi:MAG: hypothetical protein ACK40G_06585 [Cytophagaceae bacterium]